MRFETRAPRHSRFARRGVARGQALVEFTLVLLIAVPLLLTAFDLGHIFLTQNEIDQGAREGARVGVVGAALTVAKYSAIRSAAVAEAPVINIAASDITGDAPPCQSPGQADNVDPATCFYSGGATGSTVVVNITVKVYTVTPIVPMLGILAGEGSDPSFVTLSARSVGRIQSTAGRVDPVAQVVLWFERSFE